MIGGSPCDGAAVLCGRIVGDEDAIDYSPAMSVTNPGSGYKLHVSRYLPR